MEMGTAQIGEQMTAVLQQLQQTNNLVGQMAQRITSQEEQILRMQAERARAISINTVEEVPRNSSANAATSSGFGIVDNRTLGKPEVFKGDATEFPDWCFIFRSYMSCINVAYNDLMDRAERSQTPLPNRALSETERTLSGQLYFVLVMLLRNRALDIAYNAGVSEGIEAYRRLYQQYHPKVASRFVGSLSLILATKFGTDIEAELESFDKTVRRYEMESGKTLDEEILLGIVIQGVQDQSMKEHLIKNAARLNTYEAVKTELLEIARTNRVLQSMPVAMEIGATPNAKGKGGKKGGKKGDGKNSKGDSKGKGKGTQQAPQNPNKDKSCFYCGKQGHLKSECRKRISDEKNAQGKGSSKGKPKAKANPGSGKPRPNAASPDDEPEPLSAYPEETLIAAAVNNGTQEILVDTGAGSHLFVKGFDSHARSVSKGSNVGMVTVTGQPLITGEYKKSTINTDAGKFTIEYAESDKINFSVLSAGKAAQRGTWTVIGPDAQFLVPSKSSEFIKAAIEKTPNKLGLVKKRGVYWLPVSLEKGSTGHDDKPLATMVDKSPGGVAGNAASQSAGSTASCVGSPTGQEVMAAIRPAKKAVPAEALEEEAREPGAVGEMEVEDPQQVEPPLPELGEPPAEPSEPARPVRAKKIPDTVTKAEYDNHMITHLPFRNWCEFCMAGKIREDSHRRRTPGDDKEVPRVSMDYCFLGRVLDNTKSEETTVAELKEPTEEAEGVMPVLVVTDERTGCVFSSVVQKGVNDHAVNVVVEALKFCGRQKAILQTDAEHSIKALAEASAVKYGKEVQHQTAPRESHASNGAAERAVLELSRQVRTNVNALESRYKGFKLKVSSVSYPWLVRHSAWQLTRFLVKADGKTPYERLKGREYKGEVVEPFETVHYKLAQDAKGKLDAQSAIGIWVGKSLQSDEHYVGTADGIRRCRSAWRRPEGRRWELKRFEALKGVPWQPKGEPTLMPGASGTPRIAAPGTPSGRARGVYITVERQIRHGSTEGCPGCHSSDDNPKPHNATCRARFEKIIAEERAKAQQGEGSASAQVEDLEAPAADNSSSLYRDKREVAGTAAPQGVAGDSALSIAPRIAGRPASSADPAGSTAASASAKRPTEGTQEAQKRLKAPDPKGSKRDPEVSVQELQDAEDISTLLLQQDESTHAEEKGTLPTLHDVPLAAIFEDSLLAGYPEWGNVTSAFDERSGEALPLEKVKTARGRELDKMIEHNVKTDITWEEARRRGLKIVRSRWVDGWKTIDGDPRGVRSRCVAQEVNTGPREDVHSGTPPLKAHRMILSCAATKRKGQHQHDKLIGRYDVSVAFFHATSTGKIAVVPPDDLNDQRHLWYLNKAMNGTREASRQWSEFVDGTVTRKGGFSNVPGVPGVFYHKEWQVTMSCHGDDFLAEGRAEDLDKLDEFMLQHFEIKVLPRIGNPEHGGQCLEGDHLRRAIRWTKEGFTWEADRKYVKLLTKELGLEGAKGVDTPSSKLTGAGCRTSDKPLDAAEASRFRHLAGTALYLSLDRPSIQYALSEITAGMAKPCEIHMLRLKRLGRYLLKFPTETWLFALQDDPEEFQVYTDSDWASDAVTRRSMSCHMERFGEHLLDSDSGCAKQSTVALSSRSRVLLLDKRSYNRTADQAHLTMCRVQSSQTGHADRLDSSERHRPTFGHRKGQTP